MNFLAHIYLSGTDDMVRIGNFVADGIRGKKYLDYPQDMQVGIVLHRFIDTYTDAHPVFRKSTKKLHKPYGHYSGVIIDIFYDHFLAKNWGQYCTIPLTTFVDDFYNSLNANFDLLPQKFKELTPIMIEYNWLANYASIEGIQNVLNGMNRRTKGRSKMNESTRELQLYYDDFESEFFTFFEDLEFKTSEKLIELKQQYNL